MDISNIFFILLSAVTLLCAAMVVFAKNPIHSILYMILTMFSLTGHYVLLSAQFVGVINIIVYAGAIMVLFLFVLMLLNIKKENEPNNSIRWKFLGSLAGIGLLVATTFFIKTPPTSQANLGRELTPEFGYVKPLGKLLFTDYVLPFEIASILFIAAMVGVVYIGSKDPVSKS